MPHDIEKLKKRLSHPFANTERLREALTHRSYAVENNLKYDNQRLEFLGDAVLEIVLTDYLFQRYPDSDEGALTKMRSGLVRQEAIATLARELELGDYLIVGRGEQGSGGAERDSTLADLFEAVLGAYYLDAGFEAVRCFIIDLIEQRFPDPEQMLVSINPKGWLQEYSQRRWNIPPSYEVVAVSGPEHLPTFEVEARLNDWTARGHASNRKQAESRAAASLIELLRANDPELSGEGKNAHV